MQERLRNIRQGASVVSCCLKDNSSGDVYVDARVLTAGTESARLRLATYIGEDEYIRRRRRKMFEFFSIHRLQ